MQQTYSGRPTLNWNTNFSHLGLDTFRLETFDRGVGARARFEIDETVTWKNDERVITKRTQKKNIMKNSVFLFTRRKRIPTMMWRHICKVKKKKKDCF